MRLHFGHNKEILNDETPAEFGMEDQDEIETTIVDEPLVRGSRNHALYCAYTIRLLCRLMPTIFLYAHNLSQLSHGVRSLHHS